jgi:hypothetical protein
MATALPPSPVLPAAAQLRTKIRQIAANNADEPDLYAHVRDLLTRSQFKILLHSSQVVIDSKIGTSRKRPDLVVYRSEGTRPLRGPDFAAAVFEVKTGDAIRTNGKAIAKEKNSYPQAGTRWFYLIDQEVVWRIDVADPAAFHQALTARGELPASLLSRWSWTDLENPETFLDCFGAVSADRLQLDVELAAFRSNRTRFAYLDAAGDKRAAFGATIRTASETIRQAVEKVLLEKGVEDLRSALALIDGMKEVYGDPLYDWRDERRPFSFANISDPRKAALLTDEQVVEYESRLDRLMHDLEPVLYSLRIEHDLLRRYADRNGEEEASLLKLSGKANKASKRLVDALIYETASLILSRMLTIRFCEDHELFQVRYISNGGIEIFWRFAEHFALPMQELLRQSYKHAGTIFRSIFDANLLDWAVRRDDQLLSEALERAAYVLSRWDFRTVRGDILSGVYDQYLDVSQRRRLGEVYTRPEVARFMLQAAGWSPQSTVLDPACGTGTFLVEALAHQLQVLSTAGAITGDTVREVIGRLHGLDISTFSVTLAQIQVFWHLIEVVRNKSATEIRDFARSILPVLKLYGGWSSLDTMGLSLAGDRGQGSGQSGLAFRVAYAGRERAQALVPAGFERTVKGSYDVVIMNPPYIRAERSGAAGAGDAYEAVTFKNTDSSIFFIYRALQQWVKPGGTLAFIVPIGITEATYAGPLRRILQGYRIRLIADLEGLGKVTFRGVKRATVIMVVEKSPASADDDVELLQLDPSALIDDEIDFTHAKRTTVRRGMLDRLAYLPSNLRGALEVVTQEGADTPEVDEAGHAGDAVPAIARGEAAADGPVDEAVTVLEPLTTPPAWLLALRGDEGSSDAILTKFDKGDDQALLALRDLPRLGEMVKLVYVKRVNSRIADVQVDEPTHERYAYRPELLFNYGVKLGGAAALRRPADQNCVTLFKGQNIFPQGLLGAPMGEWSPTARRESTRYIYSYADHLSYQRTFAAREISQLPTIAQLLPGQGFQNTAYVIELTEDFPLHIFVLSRLIQFYAARVLRSSVIEDLGCHWYKRTLTLLPIPQDRSPANVQELTTAGQAVLEADSDIADRYRTIDALITAGTANGSSLASLIVNQDAKAVGIDVNGASETGIGIASIIEAGDQIRSSDLFFNITVPDADLRTLIRFTIERKLEADPEDLLAREHLLDIFVPGNLAEVAEAIRSLATDNLVKNYADALTRLDAIVALMCGVPDALRDHMIMRMNEDPILSKMRPMIAQRGLRVQPYADHGEDDRYD